MDLEAIKKIRMLGSSISVLLVEDEESIRLEVSRMLSKLFEDLDVAKDGAEALELYRQKSMISS